MALLDASNLAKFLPLPWFNALRACDVWMTGFRVLMPIDRQLDRGKYIDIDSNTRLLLWFGEVTHFAFVGGNSVVSAIHQNPEGFAVLQAPKSELVHDRRANWLLLLQRHRVVFQMLSARVLIMCMLWLAS